MAMPSELCGDAARATGAKQQKPHISIDYELSSRAATYRGGEIYLLFSSCGKVMEQKSLSESVFSLLKSVTLQ